MALVVGAAPWTGDPDWSQAGSAFASPTFAQLAGAVVVVAVLALALHPLQFSLIQLLEGYWGRNPMALALASSRVRHHRGLLNQLVREATEADTWITEGGTPAKFASLDLAWWESEASRLRDRYPHEPDDVRPTRLGNVLRRYERAAGNPYGLDLVTTAPLLQLVATEGDVAYVRDQRTQLDLATSMCAVSAVLTVGYVVALFPAGWWLLLAAVPYCLTYAFYRGACAVAEEYGTALYALVDLNRTALYQRLRVVAPDSLSQERDANVSLMAALRHRSQAVNVNLTHEAPNQADTTKRSGE